MKIIVSMLTILMVGCGAVDEPPEPTVSGQTRHREGRTHGEISLVQTLPPIGPVAMLSPLWFFTSMSLEKGVAKATHAAAHDHGGAEQDHGGADHDHGGADGHGDPEGDGGIEVDDPNELVPIVDNPTGAHAVVINPKGTGGTRYLLAEIYLRRSGLGDTGFKRRVAKNSKALEEITRLELEDRTVEELQKRFVQEEIKMTLLAKFNAELKTAVHQAPVKQIYFSKWVMQ